MKRSHRHELKQNEFLVWFDETIAWFSENRRRLLVGAAIAVSAAALIGGTYYLQTTRRSQAESLLREALKQFHGRIRESSVVQAASGPEFASTEERYQKSLEAFEAIIERFSGLEQGRQARYYAALCHVGLGHYDKADVLLQEVNRGRRDLLYYLSSQALAAVKVERGEFQSAGAIYALLLEDTANPMPKDRLLFDLARARERAGELEEARRSYQRVLDEYPESQMRGDALEKTEFLAHRLES